MSEKIIDKEFGEMEYRHGWIKKEKVPLLGKDYDLNIIASAYTGEKICDEQRDAYKKFKGKLDKITKRMPEMISDYVRDHKSEIEEHYAGLGDPEGAINLVTPVSVLFARDGKIVIMCNAEWDEENGLGIEVGPEYKVDLQESFL